MPRKRHKQYNMRQFLILSTLVICIRLVCGLQCLTCQNEGSFELCNREGRRITCMPNQETCFVEVRRNAQGYQITAGCKQRDACRNIALENGNCREPRMNSVCRWCCRTHLCNDLRATSTTASPTITSRNDKAEPVPVCSLLEEPEHGSKICDLSPENKVNSVCRFSCNEGFELFPENQATTTCQSNKRWSTATPLCKRKRCLEEHNLEHGSVHCTDENFVSSQCFFICNESDNYHLFPAGQDSSTCLASKRWSMETPCCLRECPRYAEVDLVILLDSSSSVGRANWVIMKEFTLNITKQFTIRDDAAHIAVVRYNGKVDVKTEIRLDSAENFEQFQEKYKSIQYNGHGTRTGRALTYVRDTLLSEENGNRAGVPDVVLTITDGTSQDDVETISRELRDDGVTTFALGIQSVHGRLNRDQLLEIAGSEEHYMEASAGFTQLDNALMDLLTEKLCRFQCRERESNEP